MRLAYNLYCQKPQLFIIIAKKLNDMKTFLLILVLITCSFVTVMAQTQSSAAVHKVSIGAELAFPTGDLATSYGFGYGVSAQGEYNVLPNLNATISGGYLELAYSKLYKDLWQPWLDYKLKNTVVYPVKAGAKYYFGKRYYSAAEVGAAITSEEGRATALSFAGGFGTSIAISPKSSVDVGARYEVWSMNGTTTFIGVRAAYSFGLK